jgi:hypothetical protein
MSVYVHVRFLKLQTFLWNMVFRVFTKTHHVYCNPYFTWSSLSFFFIFSHPKFHSVKAEVAQNKSQRMICFVGLCSSKPDRGQVTSTGYLLFSSVHANAKLAHQNRPRSVFPTCFLFIYRTTITLHNPNSWYGVEIQPSNQPANYCQLSIKLETSVTVGAVVASNYFQLSISIREKLFLFCNSCAWRKPVTTTGNCGLLPA